MEELTLPSRLPREKRFLALLIGRFDLHEATLHHHPVFNQHMVACNLVVIPLYLTRLAAAGQNYSSTRSAACINYRSVKKHARREKRAAYSRPLVAAYACSRPVWRALISQVAFSPRGTETALNCRATPESVLLPCVQYVDQWELAAHMLSETCKKELVPGLQLRGQGWTIEKQAL